MILLHLFFWAIEFNLKSYSGGLNAKADNHFPLLTHFILIFGYMSLKSVYVIERDFPKYFINKYLL